MAHTTETAIIEGTEITIAKGSKGQTVNVPKSGNERREYEATYRSEQQKMWTDQQKLERDIEKLADLGAYLEKRGFRKE